MKLSPRYLVGGLSLAVGLMNLTACGASASPGGDETVSTAASAYTSEPLLRGILFGEGEVATRLPELWTGDEIAAASAPDKRAAHDEFVASVAKKDPAFLASFATEMQSGDPVRVEATLKHLDELVGAVKPQQVVGGGCLVAMCAITIYPYIIAVVTEAGHVVPQMAGKLGLAHDQAIALLASRFGRS
jgi:SdpC family antimicrobial peptide